MISMSAYKPNKTQINAEILALESAVDGFGGWAKIFVDTAGTHMSVPSLEGKTLRAFVSPSLFATLHGQTRYFGHISFQGEANRTLYVLVP